MPGSPKYVNTLLVYFKVMSFKWFNQTVYAYLWLKCLVHSSKLQETVFKYELDEVGPVDKRPSPNMLHHFVQKKKEKKIDM